jgi:methionyl-tRNA formyltransferase
VEGPDDPRLRRLLIKSRPDILVLAGTGIVPANVLSVPTMVTLNAHFGLLPWVRGVCPLENALLRGVPLGVTVHAVDPGIDTGPLIRRVLLPVGENDTDRIAVAARLEEAAIGELVGIVKGLLSREPLSLRPQGSRHPYGSWISTIEREKAAALLSNGEAVRLYNKWRGIAGGDVLSLDDAHLPGPRVST